MCVCVCVCVCRHTHTNCKQKKNCEKLIEPEKGSLDNFLLEHNMIKKISWKSNKRKRKLTKTVIKKI